MLLAMLTFKLHLIAILYMYDFYNKTVINFFSEIKKNMNFQR